jgi:hypothetical protein
VCPPSYGFNNTNTISYSQFSYQQSWPLNSANVNYNGYIINTSQELQIFNGLYTAVPSVPYTSGNVIGYSNYSTYYSNGNTNPNYSTVSTGATAYRYATFCWKINSGVAAAKFIFTIKNCNCLFISQDNNITYSFKNSNTPQGQRFLMFYRTEQITSTSGNPDIINVNPVGSDTLTSIWIDANSSPYGTSIIGTTPTYQNNDNITPLSSTNFYSNQDGTIGNGATIRGVNSRTVNINTNIITVPNITANALGTGVSMYVYCRIGIPMTGINVSFTNVTLSLSN